MKNKKIPNIKKTEAQSLLDILKECGSLKHTIDQTLTVVLWAYPGTNKSKLKARLEDSESEEYNAYQGGLILGDHKIELALHKDAQTGDTFAVEALQKLQTDKAVERAIKENFFPED